VKTERDVPLTIAGPVEAMPEKVKEVEATIAGAKDVIVTSLGVFRTALRTWATDWMRDRAKRAAIAQNAHTLSLGKGEISRLKQAIEDHAQAPLGKAIADEFTPAKYGSARTASSGQVATVLARRFEQGIRGVLATLGPILGRFGYAEEPLVEEEPREDEASETDRAPRYLPGLELPGELEDLIEKVAEAITDIKVAEAKLECYGRQREKQMAAELWEKA
jgi:hypothetical protein